MLTSSSAKHAAREQLAATRADGAPLTARLAFASGCMAARSIMDASESTATARPGQRQKGGIRSQSSASTSPLMKPGRGDVVLNVSRRAILPLLRVAASLDAIVDLDSLVDIGSDNVEKSVASDVLD